MGGGESYSVIKRRTCIRKSQEQESVMERTDEKRKNGLRAKIVFIGNYKGGAGKTTSVLNFGTHFAKMGKKGSGAGS